MPFFNPNIYYNPFINPGIFGIYGSRADFIRDLYGVRTPVVPPKPAPGWEDVESKYSPLMEAERKMAPPGGPIYNPETDKFENPLDEGIKDKTDKETKDYGILPWVGAGLYGLNTLGNLFLGWRSLDLAREQFNFQRDLANQNLAASIQAYNEAQRARLRGRGFTEEEVDRMMKEQGRELKDTRKRK